MGKDSSEIRREIEETRGRMGDTVEALSYKADVPARVKDAVDERVETVRGTIGSVVGGVKERVGAALGGAKRVAAEKLEETSEDVEGVTEKVTSNVKNTVGNVAGKLPNGQDVRNAAQRGVGIAAENPLGLALGALAVGFLAGLAAPVTELEREKIGPLRDELLERAKTVGSDALEHGKQVLQETAQAALGAAQQAAQEHGQQVLDEAKGDTAHSGSQSQGQQQ
jgi:hypothetical protein